MKSITLTHSTIRLDDDGYLWVKFHTGDEVMEVEHMKKQIETIVSLCKGKPHLFIIDGRGEYANITEESRKYAAGHPEMAKLRKAEAILVDKLPNRITANAFIKFDKPPNPAKIFDDPEKAKKWLKQFK